VGSSVPLTAISITSANNLTAGIINAASLTGSGITGLATFNGALATTGSSGINLSANSLTLNGNVTTTGTGPLAIALTGTSPLTIANGVAISLDGAFTQTGTGSVVMGGSLVTTNDLISFASGVTLTADVSMNTGAGAGNIVFSGTVDGAYGLTLTAGTGSISFVDTVGQLTPPTSLTINSATNLTLSQGVVINGPFASTVSTLSTISGPLSTTTSAGLSITTEHLLSITR